MVRNEMNAVIEEIRAERIRQVRQVDAEGWSPEHDDRYGGELAQAAAAYAFHASYSEPLRGTLAAALPPTWPWARNLWKPTTPRRDLVKAAALIVAEIERIDRMGTRHD